MRAQQANVSIEITANDALADRQPCENAAELSEPRTSSSRSPCRCATAKRGAAPYHEVMHVMGVRGHPKA
jgi:hypothetical protein